MSTAEWQARSSTPLNSQASLPEFILKVLAARGIDDARLDQFLKPSLKSLKPPQSMGGMERAVERLMQAFDQDEKIALYADFDLDGTSGLALLHRGLELLGFAHVTAYQPKRLTEGYGFHSEAVEDLSSQGISLIVTIDVGITALTTVQRANELGCDVIITDHHLPLNELPQAYAVINPNTTQCEAELGHLCGAGVAFYLLWALRAVFAERKILPKNFDLKSVLDCFAIGTLTDMVPLKDENRVLVKHGLKVLENTQRPGLKYLLQELGLLGRALTSQDVAIRFAPKLNALSRLERGLRPIDIFLEEDEERAKALVADVMKSNSQRLELQKFAEAKALELLDQHPSENFVFVTSPDFHQGIVGLVATKLAQNLGKPAFVGALSEKGTITGSARIPKDSGYNLVEALAFATKAFNRHGGHAAAAGFELQDDKASEAAELLQTYFSNLSDEARLAPPVFYDAEARLQDFNDDSLTWLEHLGPYGAEFEVPTFRVQNLQVIDIKNLRGGHIKLTLLDSETADRGQALWFFAPAAEELESMGLVFGARVDLLCETQWNYFAGRRTIQLLVRDIRCL